MTRLSVGELIKVRKNYGIEVVEGNDFVLGDEELQWGNESAKVP